MAKKECICPSMQQPHWGCEMHGRSSQQMDPAAACRKAVPREFWDLLHEWADSTGEERRDAIEHRFGELFRLAASPVSAPDGAYLRLMEKALNVLTALRADEEATYSFTQLDDDLRPEVDAVIAALRARLGEGAK